MPRPHSTRSGGVVVERTVAEALSLKSPPSGRPELVRRSTSSSTSTTPATAATDVGFDNVPDGGTGFDFLPRLGGGFTKALTPSEDGESRGPRLMIGVRWHHISNGRIASDTRNPSRDSILGYIAITFPF